MPLKFNKLLGITVIGLALAVTIPANAIDNRYKSSTNVKPLQSNNFTIPVLEGGVSITANPRLITMSLRESDTKQVLRMLADKAGMNIILHDSVSGTVTLDLVNVTLNKAFEYVMVMNNLAYWIDGNTLIVASKDASKDLAFAQQKIQTFDVKYENAGHIAEFLNKNIYKLKNPGLSSDEIAVTNPNTNQIMIIGTDKDFAIARKIIAQFDKKVETVMFDVNHLAPGKMAGIICHKVFKTEDIKDDDGDSEGKGGAKIACSSKDIEGSEVEGSTFTSFKSSGMVVSYYPDLGKIGVSGATPEQLDLIREVLAQNDVKQPQAIIEIAMIELGADGSKTINPTWSVVAGTMSFAMDNGTLTADFGNLAAIDTNPFSVTAKLVYSIQNGKARMLSNPKILVKNNVESTFDSTQEYISNVTTQQSTSTINPITSQNVETDTYGVKLTLKPTITPDGYIYLDLNPSYSAPSGSVKVGGSTTSQDMTLVSERSVELKGVRLKDNETLIIGGLITEQEKKSTNKIPVLGDIPVLGVAFRSSTKTSDKKEMVIIVTPKILKDDEPIMERM